MVLGGSRNPEQAELDRTLKELVTRQRAIDKRVERLETLEFDQKSIGQGCVSFLSFDDEPAATKVLSIPDQLASGNYPYAQLTIFWYLESSAEAVTHNLFMRVSGLAVNYQYNYKYSKGAVMTTVGLNGQTAWFVGRIPGAGAGNTFNQARGHIFIPFYSLGGWPSAFGEWTHYELTAGANLKQEKGEWGGHQTSGSSIITSITFFASAGNLQGSIYLYGWCPEVTAGGGPDD